MNELEEYKELYYKEIEYTERLNSKINTCITFLTIIGSGVILVWSQIDEMPSSIFWRIYFGLCAISSLSFIICIILFYMTYSGYEVHYYPIKEMAIARNKTLELVSDKKLKKEQAEEHVRNMMCERYLNDAIHNRKQNRLKNKRHRRLIHLIAITFMILLINYAFSIYFSSCVSTDSNVNNCSCFERGGDKWQIMRMKLS